MASYAALVSLKTVVDSILNHPNPPITLPNRQVEALLQEITFLQVFLQLYSHREDYPADDLEILIRETAYAAEDVIESYIVNQIGGSTSHPANGFYQDLQKVVEEMDVIKKKAMEIKEKMGDDEDHHHVSWMTDAPPVSPSLRQKSTMVGFDDVLIEILDQLTAQRSSRQIIPILGMGGIGKTTLAFKAFEHGLVAYHFDIRVWVIISQKFRTREILLEIISQRSKDRKETLSHLSQESLGERIHKTFSGLRYLIVMDDMWSVDAWNEIVRFLPDNKNGSVIMTTTRISNLARQLTSSSGFQLNFLDEDESWKLFSRTVFREDSCPLELEEIGKSVVENCRGLPLSIVVVGGLLAKSPKTKLLTNENFSAYFWIR